MNILSSDLILRLARQRYNEANEELDNQRFEIKFRSRSAQIRELFRELKETRKEREVTLADMKDSADAFSDAVDSLRRSIYERTKHS